MDALDETIRRESRARGITPNRFARAPGDDANRGPFNILVFGDRDESEGWDADGSPTSEWPDLSLPWGPS